MIKRKIGHNSKTPLNKEKPLISIHVSIGSLLTLIDGVKLNIPNNGQLIVWSSMWTRIWMRIWSTIPMEIYPHKQPWWIASMRSMKSCRKLYFVDDIVLLPQNIIILTDKEIKNLEVGGLKEEPRIHAGNKVESVERQKKPW